MCVEERQWIEEKEFEDAIAATNLLPGPASTQLAIYCAWRLRGTADALLGGLCFIFPGLVLILVMSAVFLANRPPDWGVGGGLLAALIAFAPSFAFVLVGGRRFDQIRANDAVRSFLTGAGLAVIGAIAGSAIPLGLADPLAGWCARVDLRRSTRRRQCVAHHRGDWCGGGSVWGSCLTCFSALLTIYATFEGQRDWAVTGYHYLVKGDIVNEKTAGNAVLDGGPLDGREHRVVSDTAELLVVMEDGARHLYVACHRVQALPDGRVVPVFEFRGRDYPLRSSGN
jgi:F0F1-type ATP synthase assembly protein I